MAYKIVNTCAICGSPIFAPEEDCDNILGWPKDWGTLVYSCPHLTSDNERDTDE